MNRTARIHAALDRWTPHNDPDGGSALLHLQRRHPRRYLLVERSNFDGSHAFATFSDSAEAFEYQAEQEYAEDWDPVALVDLDRGTVAPLTRIYRTVFDEFADTYNLGGA